MVSATTKTVCCYNDHDDDVGTEMNSLEGGRERGRMGVCVGVFWMIFYFIKLIFHVVCRF